MATSNPEAIGSPTRLIDWVRGPEMHAEEIEDFAAYARELTSTFWPLLAVLVSVSALLWWPLDAIVFAHEPVASEPLGAFRARIIVIDLLCAAVLPRVAPLRPHAHLAAVTAGSVNLALTGWYMSAAGGGAPSWLYLGFAMPVFSVLLLLPLLQRAAATTSFAASLCCGWLAHPASELLTPGIPAGISFLSFIVAVDVFIGHLLFVQVQRAFHLRRRVGAQRQELQALTHHLEERVDLQTTEIHALSERARHARAEQRREIARDLHDGIGQELTSLRLLVGLRDRQRPPAGAANTLTDLDEQITRLQGSLRRILASLQPEPLADGSLLDALENLCGEMERRSGLACTFEAKRASFPLPAAISLDLFRIAQEGVTNAVRHARASALIVRLHGHGDRLVLIVEDDGVGFDPATAKLGHGTRNIRERAEHLGGAASWTFDLGTRLEVSVPLEHRS